MNLKPITTTSRVSCIISVKTLKLNNIDIEVLYIILILKKTSMKKINWKIAAFVAWIVMTFMVIDAGLKGVSKADTMTNIVSVAILLFWILVSIATNCLTFKNNKKDEKN